MTNENRELPVINWLEMSSRTGEAHSSYLNMLSKRAVNDNELYFALDEGLGKTVSLSETMERLAKATMANNPRMIYIQGQDIDVLMFAHYLLNDQIFLVSIRETVSLNFLSIVNWDETKYSKPYDRSTHSLVFNNVTKEDFTRFLIGVERVAS
ncbi:MAG: hypothetical protein IBX57_00645 [Gammaproteobacteria bacterium]|nr:hypothetical protein [Gammaproteobacteria bacterium]